MVGKRPITWPLSQALAFAAAFLILVTPTGAAEPHVSGTPHHLVQLGGDAAARALVPPAGAAMPCCPAGMGQAGGSGCSELLCASVPGALETSLVSAVPVRLLRAYFPAPHGGLTPHYPRPEHGPPRA